MKKKLPLFPIATPKKAERTEFVGINLKTSHIESLGGKEAVKRLMLAAVFDACTKATIPDKQMKEWADAEEQKAKWICQGERDAYYAGVRKAMEFMNR